MLFCFFSAEMNTISYPEASADGAEELSCGPTARRERNDGKKEFKFSQEQERRPHNCVQFRCFTLGLRGLGCTFTPFWPFPTELIPRFLKLANKRGPENLELETGAKGKIIHGVFWRLRSLHYSRSQTDYWVLFIDFRYLHPQGSSFFCRNRPKCSCFDDLQERLKQRQRVSGTVGLRTEWCFCPQAGKLPLAFFRPERLKEELIYEEVRMLFLALSFYQHSKVNRGCSG